MQVLKQFWRLVTPVKLRRLFFDFRECVRAQEFENGHWRSVSEQAAVDKAGNPIPWITYPATEYLRQLDLSTRTVFEYGSGNSTLFWAGIAKSVVSVESDPKWYNLVSGKLSGKANAKVVLATEKDEYVNHIRQYPPFDVIFIDGVHRFACAEAALKHLSPEGMIIVDNAETFARTTTLLRSAGLIQVDMIGAIPILTTIQATSFFFQRTFAIASREPIQPLYIWGKRWHKHAEGE